MRLFLHPEGKSQKLKGWPFRVGRFLSIFVWAYHSTPFTAEWSVRKTSIALSTLDAELQTSPPPMMRLKKDLGGRMEWNCLYWRVTLLFVTPRLQRSSLETPWREDAEHLYYVPPHWSYTGYYDMGRYWITLSLSSSTYFRYFKQPALHLLGVGARCPSLLQCLSTAIFHQDNARPNMARVVQGFFVNHQIELLLWSARSPDLSPIENMWSMVAQWLTQITSPAATPDQLW